MDPLFEKVKKAILEQKDLPGEKITLEAKLADDLGLDSMAQILMVSTIEDDLGIEFDEEVYEKIKTVGDAVKALEELGI